MSIYFNGLVELLDLCWKDTFDKVVVFNPELKWYAHDSVMSGKVPHICILVLQKEKKKKTDNENKKHKFIDKSNIYQNFDLFVTLQQFFKSLRYAFIYLFFYLFIFSWCWILLPGYHQKIAGAIRKKYTLFPFLLSVTSKILFLLPLLL